MNFSKIKEIRKRIPVGISEAKSLIESHSSIIDAVTYWKDQQKIAENQPYGDINKVWMFDLSHCENIEASDKEELKLLSESYCSELWSEYVTDKHRHLMLVHKDEDWKITNKVSQQYNWLSDWNNDKHVAFYRIVAPLLQWEMDDIVYFFWNRHSGIETQWNLVCKYWISFLYDDEMNIVVNPKSNNVLILGVHGYVAIGERAA